LIADGYIMSHEWTLYVFDAAMMVGVLSVSIRNYSLFKKGYETCKQGEQIDVDEYAQLPA